MKNNTKRFAKSRILILSWFIVTIFGISCINPSGPKDDTQPSFSLNVPLVNSIFPVYNDTGIALNKNISIVFSEAMDPSSLSDSTFLLKHGDEKVAGLVTYQNQIATFTPINPLSPHAKYKAILTADVVNLKGNKMAKTFFWEFTAGNSLERSTPVKIAGNLGGLFLRPGLYKSSSPIEISTGNLTLDGEGDPNATFIFRIDSELIIANGCNIVLTGEVKACNIYWEHY